LFAASDVVVNVNTDYLRRTSDILRRHCLHNTRCNLQGKLGESLNLCVVVLQVFALVTCMKLLTFSDTTCATARRTPTHRCWSTAVINTSPSCYCRSECARRHIKTGAKQLTPTPAHSRLLAIFSAERLVGVSVTTHSVLRGQVATGLQASWHNSSQQASFRTCVCV